MNAWKHHKLGNTIEKNSLRNKDLLINNVESVSNKYGFIRQTEQFDDYTVASNDLSNYYIILEKFFAYNPSRINVGSIAYKTAGSPVSIVSPLYVSFSTKDMVDDRFLWYWFKTNEFKQQREKYSEGGVRDTLSYNQLSKMNILLPELNEQIKIGKYLDSLTKTIAIHQRKPLAD
ncbi:restriction endonuclease subunit S [Enterococcus cecorum]|uniref:restriction endonuclease subunit S n=1 Tax=Enterococcus cecorum TaxID=44008 RepID=UPI000DE97936|nr:restriction endonuclease subunit S [Enterococcus cecorum]